MLWDFTRGLQIAPGPNARLGNTPSVVSNRSGKVWKHMLVKEERIFPIDPQTWYFDYFGSIFLSEQPFLHVYVSFYLCRCTHLDGQNCSDCQVFSPIPYISSHRQTEFSNWNSHCADGGYGFVSINAKARGCLAERRLHANAPLVWLTSQNQTKKGFSSLTRNNSSTSCRLFLEFIPCVITNIAFPRNHLLYLAEAKK